MRFKVGELAMVIPCPNADERTHGKIVEIVAVGPMLVDNGWGMMRSADYRISVEGDPHWYCLDDILLKLGDPDQEEQTEEQLELTI